MIVPNYVPEPLEVPGNVADERYAVRLTFIRRVTLVHLASCGLVVAFGFAAWPELGFEKVLGCLCGTLLALDLWRIWKRGQRVEGQVSAWLIPFPLAFASWFAHEGLHRGWPVAAILAGPICAATYTLLCGRDFSFVGCTTLSLVCSTVALAAVAIQLGAPARQAATMFSANAAYLLYLEYDLASLLSRRRRGEEIAAVVDLYRDVFNIFGYILRVIRHWRKHRIWA